MLRVQKQVYISDLLTEEKNSDWVDTFISRMDGIFMTLIWLELFTIMLTLLPYEIADSRIEGNVNDMGEGNGINVGGLFADYCVMVMLLLMVV